MKRAKRPAKNTMADRNVSYLSDLRIIDDCMIFNEVTGHFFRCDASAAYVIKALQKQTPIPALIAAFAEHFEISPAIARRDVELFLDALLDGGIA
jgi:Coenzyme PQQ synthesis protein D (PqqD)